jgi:hypothetical protein
MERSKRIASGRSNSQRLVADAMSKEHRMARAPRYVGVGFIRPEKWLICFCSGRWDIREETAPP